MPSLESLKINMDDDEKRFPDIRVRHRNEVAQAIGEPSLPANERAQPPVPHRTGVPDPLSSAILEFSLNLVTLKLEGRDEVPSQPLYTDQSQAITAHSDLHLEKFDFHKEAGYASLDPVHVFRSKADDSILPPFVEAYADALLMMPKLNSAALVVQLEDHIEGEPGWFYISYFAPYKSAHNQHPRLIYPRCNSGVIRQLVTLLLGWEPDEKLAAKLRRAGAEFRAEPMVEMSMAEFMKYHGVEDDISEPE
ncbi:hypothetical protein LY76DRAFT_614805 [Colletotrichum caudatum]|nr:hypothetical protein LY76DRAFT_614805 [Colletotrichum caudatum]